MTEENHLHKIKDGTVIDHIKRGLGRKILELIGASNDVIVIGLNLDSPKFDKKDMLKYANRVLEEKNLQLIAALSPEATVSVIQDWKVVSKSNLSRPEIMTGVIKCPNPKCITNHERVQTKMYTFPTFKCFHCERSVKPNEMCSQ